MRGTGQDESGRIGEGRVRPWRRWLGAEVGQGTLHRVRAADGVELGVVHVRAPAGVSRGGHPVMLVHGLASNRYSLHFPGRSLARWLAARGYDSYVVELRGSGRSQRPHSGWDLDDHVVLDVAALLGWIREHSGRDGVHWIGHSMGGILLWCYVITHGGAGVVSGLTVGSALDYRTGATGFRPLLKLRPLLERVPSVPWGALVHALSPALGRRVRTPLEHFNVVPSNIEPEVSRRLHANAFGTIPTRLLTSLATTFEARGLRNRDGSVRYWEEAGSFTTPVCLLAGTGDRQVSVGAIEATAARFPDAHVRVLGRGHGEADDYGHFDLLIGRRARSEVWPVIAQWLDHQEEG